jgi:hypothetical protein
LESSLFTTADIPIYPKLPFLLVKVKMTQLLKASGDTDAEMAEDAGVNATQTQANGATPALAAQAKEIALLAEDAHLAAPHSMLL